MNSTSGVIKILVFNVFLDCTAPFKVGIYTDAKADVAAGTTNLKVSRGNLQTLILNSYGTNFLLGDSITQIVR